jgi:hypothetical protein
LELEAALVQAGAALEQVTRELTAERDALAAELAKVRRRVAGAYTRALFSPT